MNVIYEPRGRAVMVRILAVLLACIYVIIYTVALISIGGVVAIAAVLAVLFGIMILFKERY